MLTRDKKLIVFEDFQIDHNLPKHIKPLVESETLSVNEGWGVPTSGGFLIDTNESISNGVGDQLINYMQYKKDHPDYNRTLIEKLQYILVKWIFKYNKVQKRNKKVHTMTVKDFFGQLSKTSLELKDVKDIGKFYEQAIARAISAGQTALREKLEADREVIRAESYLIEYGLTKYVTEEQVASFYSKVFEKKNLKLNWIKNFIRPIPSDILEIKKGVDELNIFDNYVILHYDPKDNGSDDTAAEKEKKKDPILFGVMKGSRKLYFIADWKDEVCDLTLEEMFKTLGKDVLEINNETVKSYINKIVKDSKKKKDV